MSTRQKLNKPRCGLVLIESLRFKEANIGANTPGGTYHSRLEQKAKILIDKLSVDFEIVYPGLVYKREKIHQIFKVFVNKEVDFIIAVFMSWAEDFAWVRFLRDMPNIPLILYLPLDKEIKFKDSLSEDDFAQFLASGGLVGTLEGSGSLRRMDKRVRVIASEGEESFARIKSFGVAAKARNVLRNTKFGLLRSFNEVMWSTYIDPYRFFVQVGPEVTFLSCDMLKEKIDKVANKEVDAYMKQLKSQYKVLAGVDEKKFFESAKASIGIANLAIDLELDAVVLNDIDTQLHKKIGLRPGFYHPSFNDNLSVLVPEGDVGTASLMLAIKVMTKEQVNFVEPFYIDIKNNSFAGGHAGPTDHTDPTFKNNVLIAPDTRYKDSPFKFAGAPFAWYRIPPGLKTMAHLSECRGNYKIVETIVKSLPGKHILSGYSHSIFKTMVPVAELFEKITDIGTTQHFALVDGDIRRELEEFAFISGFENYSL